MEVYKHIRFVKQISGGKTSVWNCHNKSNGTVLGAVEWYGPWKRYCYFPELHLAMVYSAGCLDDIADFIKTEMQNRKDMVREE